MRINGQRIATWSSQHGWSGDSRPDAGAGQGRPDLSGAQIPKPVLIGANLSDMFLDHAVLTGAWLGVADLSFTALSGTNLSGADLSDANLISAPLNGANLNGANLTGAPT